MLAVPLFFHKGEGHTTRGAGVEQIWWSLVDRVRQGFSGHEFFFLAHAWTQLNIFILTFFKKIYWWPIRTWLEKC
jgi:hypothetical protein